MLSLLGKYTGAERRACLVMQRGLNGGMAEEIEVPPCPSQALLLPPPLNLPLVSRNVRGPEPRAQRVTLALLSALSPFPAPLRVHFVRVAFNLYEKQCCKTPIASLPLSDVGERPPSRRAGTWGGRVCPSKYSFLVLRRF